MEQRLRILLSLFIAIQYHSSFSQENIVGARPFVVSGDIFGTRNFIENKGQFQNPLKDGEAVLFLYEHSGEKIHFTRSGVIYEFVKVKAVTEDEEEEENEEKEGRNKRAEAEENAERHYTSMSWLNNSGNIAVEPIGKQSHYFTFGGPEYNSYAYKQLLYRNVYQNIDILYELPSEKNNGIKYSIILHPGANPADIQIAYSGDVKKMNLQPNGDVIIKTTLDEITEHAPVAMDSDKQPVQCTARLKGKVIHYDFPAGYNPSKEIVIDPWVTTITTLANNNYGYDVDHDFGGNTFIYGGNVSGSARCKVAMYNNSGTLQWTFSGTIVSPNWNSGSSWSSNFKVNKGTGKTYVGRNNGLANIVRLNTAGNYDNFLSNGANSIGEVWNMEFNCSGDILVFGGISSSGEVVSLANGSITLISTFNPTITGCCQDVVAEAIDAAGNLFVYYNGHTFLGNKMVQVTPSFTNNLWTASSGFTDLVYLANKSLYVGANAGNAVAFNALDVNMNYLFYYDGGNLAAYNKTNGSMVASTTVSGLTSRVQGGIAVDDCDNIYVGGNGSIRCFHFNGTSFSTLTPIALNTTVTNQYVYDIKLNKFLNLLYVSGSGFVGTYSTSISQTCTPSMVNNPCSFGQGGITASSTSITCANLGSATVSAYGGIGPYSYTWMPGGQTTSVVTGLSPGIYTVAVYDNGANFYFISTTVFNPLIPLTGNAISSGGVPCFGSTTATASIINLAGGSGNQSYLWTDGTNTQTTSAATGLGAGSWSVTVTDALTGCVLNDAFVIYQPTQLNMFISASTPTACTGDSILLGNVVWGGAPSYSFLWTAGPATGTMTVSEPVAGVHSYTLTANDQNNCPIVATATLNFIPHPFLSVSNITICPLATGTITVTGATSYTWSNNLTSSSFTTSPSSNTVYSVTGEALSCKSTATASVYIDAIPVPLFGSNSPRCVNNNLQLYGSGGTSYQWSGPLNYSSTLQNPTLSIVTLSNAGVYNLTVTAANGCTASISGSVVINPNPSVTASSGTVCTTQTLNLTANSNLPVNYFWAGPNNFTSTAQNPSINNPVTQASGQYTVVAVTPLNCSNTAQANAQVILPPSLSPYLSSNTTCAQPLNGSPNTVTINVSGAISYTLVTSANVANSSPNPPYHLSAIPPYPVAPSQASGTITGSNGICSSSITAGFYILGNPTISLNNSAPALCLGESYSFYAQGATEFTWNPGFPVLNLSSNGAVASLTPAVSTLFSVIGSSLGCNSALINANITVKPIPTLTITPSKSSICIGNSIELKTYGTANSFTWLPASGIYQTDSNSVNAKPTVDQVYFVIGGLNGCTTSAVASITVLALPKPGVTVPNPEVCLYEKVYLNGTGGLTYLWKGPGGISLAGSSVVFTADNPNLSGTYTLIVSDANGCINSTFTQVIIKSLPYGELTGNYMSACIPFCSDFTFKASSAQVVPVWEIADRHYEGNKFRHCFHKEGDHTITGKYLDKQTGCVNSNTFVVNAFPIPEADFTWLPENPIEGPDDVHFLDQSKGNDINKWAWSFVNNNGLKSNVQNPSLVFKEAGRYPVALVVKNNYGCSDTVVKVLIVDADFLFYVPNVFTPNSDRLNEKFMPVTRAVLKYSLSIFDRWGEQLFHTTDTNEGWDGTYKGRACKQDVYIYRININTERGEAKEYKGHFSLLR